MCQNNSQNSIYTHPKPSNMDNDITKSQNRDVSEHTTMNHQMENGTKLPEFAINENLNTVPSSSSMSGNWQSQENCPTGKKVQTAEEKKKNRLLANRRSARESRERRKNLQNGLETSVASLTQMHATLVEENDSLKSQLASMIHIPQHMNQGPELSLLMVESFLQTHQQQLMPPSNTETELSNLQNQQLGSSRSSDRFFFNPK